MISEKDMIDYSKQLDSNTFIFSFKTISSMLERNDFKCRNTQWYKQTVKEIPTEITTLGTDRTYGWNNSKYSEIWSLSQTTSSIITEK